MKGLIQIFAASVSVGVGLLLFGMLIVAFEQAGEEKRKDHDNHGSE